MYPEKEVFFPFSSEKKKKKYDGKGEGVSWEGGEPGNIYFMSNDIVLTVSNILWGLEW